MASCVTSNRANHQFNDQTTERSVRTVQKHSRIFRTAEYQNATSESQKLEFKAAVQAISDAVKNYEQATLQERVVGLASETLNIPADRLKVDTLTTDHPTRRNIVYFISQVGSNNLALVVKTYRSHEENDFLKEIDGLSIFREQQLEHSNASQLLRVGKTTVDNEAGAPITVFIAAYSPLSGDTLSKHIKSSEVALRAIKKLGKALGELHTKESGTITLNEFIATVDSNYNKMLTNFEEYPKMEAHTGKEPNAGIIEMYRSIDLDLLVKYIAKLTSDLPDEKEALPVGLVHGDAHLKNFLYEPKTDALSMVDLGSVEQKLVMQDFYHVCEHIQDASLPAQDASLPEEEKEALKDQFKKALKDQFIEGYHEGGSVAPRQKLLDLMSLNNQMLVLGTHRWIDVYSQTTQRNIMAAIIRSHHNLVNSLNNFKSTRL